MLAFSDVREQYEGRFSEGQIRETSRKLSEKIPTFPFCIGPKLNTMRFVLKLALHRGRNVNLCNLISIGPGPPQNFMLIVSTTASLSFSWNLPIPVAGVNSPTRYIVRCEPQLEGIDTPALVNQSVSQETATVIDLFPGVTYRCRVTAMNDRGEGDPAELSVMTLETGECELCNHYKQCISYIYVQTTTGGGSRGAMGAIAPLKFCSNIGSRTYSCCFSQLSQDRAVAVGQRAINLTLRSRPHPLHTRVYSHTDRRLGNDKI